MLVHVGEPPTVPGTGTRTCQVPDEIWDMAASDMFVCVCVPAGSMVTTITSRALRDDTKQRVSDFYNVKDFGLMEFLFLVFPSLESKFWSNCCTQHHPVFHSTQISAELQDLLRKLMTKDPEKRISVTEMRTHPWILKTTRTIPSKEENCSEEIAISEEDIQSAIKPFYTPIHILVRVCVQSVAIF